MTQPNKSARRCAVCGRIGIRRKSSSLPTASQSGITSNVPEIGAPSASVASMGTSMNRRSNSGKLP
jgi:hypothetical protein